MTRAEVPDNVPVLVHSPVGLVSFQPSEYVSGSNHSVIAATLSREMMSGTSGLPSMEATNLASSGVEVTQAPAPDNDLMSLPP